MKNMYLSTLLLFISYATSAKCYWSGCGCPPFSQPWCSESSYSSGWCSQSASNCGACSGVYSESCGAGPDPVTTASPTSAPTKSPTSAPTNSPVEGAEAIVVNEGMVAFFEGASYTGDGTYYTGHSTACEIMSDNSELAQNLATVAVGADDFYEGLSCGMCIEVTSMVSSGPGNDIVATPFTAMVTDLCAGCVKGDIDLLMDDKTGRNPTTWKPVPCPVGKEPLRYRIKTGSHTWYLKFQVRHASRPINKVYLVGKNGGWVELRNTGHNNLGGHGHFDTNVPNVDNVLSRPYNFPLTVRVCDIYGKCVDDVIQQLSLETDQVGLHQLPNLD